MEALERHAYREGDRVVAVVQVVEEDSAPDPAAEPCEPGFVHCVPGDLGTVWTVEADGSRPTVVFDRGGCTLVGPWEIRPLLPGGAMLYPPPVYVQAGEPAPACG